MKYSGMTVNERCGQAAYFTLMMSEKLYISSADYQILQVPRLITHYRWAMIDERDCLYVEIDKPILFKQGSDIEKEMTTVYLANHFMEDSPAFKELNSFPLDVYVLMPKSLRYGAVASFGDLVNIAWASLYDNFEDAKSHRLD